MLAPASVDAHTNGSGRPSPDALITLPKETAILWEGCHDGSLRRTSDSYRPGPPEQVWAVVPTVNGRGVRLERGERLSNPQFFSSEGGLVIARTRYAAAGTALRAQESPLAL